ncbi:cystathionine gamma-synthase [Coccidioides immitis RMSCC 3703]|uniref:Cystathionine gamma-synthase n=1 Tax=Coccidioides immitis RMSCC 3703 TaxID=454286 RepID=A0A0J8R4S1_COCIT|nr:cystathionine gamma-synthase [Coccidioides immitis RMSCC 3703]
MAESIRSKMEDLNLNGCSNATVAIHADDPINVVTDVAPPLHVSTTFRYSDNPDELVPLAEESQEIPSPTSHVYSRYTAPNYTRFETIVSALLGGHSVTYASGLAALNAALIFFNPKRISVGNGYHGSHGVISIISRLTGLKKIDLDCPAEHTFGLLGCRTVSMGCRYGHASGTKYLGGHSDMLCGVLATKNDEWRHKLFMDRQYLGNMMGNMESWLGVRSLRTLEVRVQRQSENATSLVAFLDQALKVPNPAANDPARVVQAAVKEIFHSSLQENDMAWLSKQMPGGFGPVFSMTMKEERHARAIPSKLKFFHHATSLGGVESLIEWRAMSDDTVDRKLLRLSVGLESWTDLRDDLLAGFQACLNL